MINSREAYEQKEHHRKSARESHLENELKITKDRLQHLENHIVNRAAIEVCPPIMLDTDASAAYLKSQKKAHAEYKHIFFNLYWKGKNK